MSNSRILLSMAMRSAGLAACALAGCNGSSHSSGAASASADSTTVKSVAVTPASQTMKSGETAQYKSTATYMDGHTADVSASTTWSVDAAACASVDANSGMLSAVQGIGTCNVKVKATYTASGSAAVTNTAPATVNGLYSTPVALPNMNAVQPNAIVLGDFNGDGKVDVLATDLAGGINVSLGAGNGAFGVSAAVALTGTLAKQHLVSGDFNGDGKADVVVAVGTGLAYLPGSASGPFGVPVIFATQLTDASGIAAGDFNGDGKLDIAVARGTSGSVSVLLGTGAGTFGTATDIALGTNPQFVAVADVNGDGKADLVVADYVAGKISVLLGDGNGSFGTAIMTTTEGHASVSDKGDVRLALGDFDGDGNVDIAVSNGTSSVQILLGDGSGSFKAGGDIAVGSTVVSVAAADVNGDGHLDIVAVGANTGTAGGTANVRIAYGTGTGSFGVPVTLNWSNTGGVPVAVTTVDLNGDGKVDLLVPDASATGSVTMLVQE